MGEFNVIRNKAVAIELDFEKRYRLVREIIETVVLTLLMFLIIRMAVQNFNIDGMSMEPGLHNQELILAAFEESGWPPRLDDPLPPVPDMDSKRRLRDATARLNGNQKRRLIRFHGDGSGRGLCWEFLR